MYYNGVNYQSESPSQSDNLSGSPSYENDNYGNEEDDYREGYDRVVVISEADKERVKKASELLVMSPPGQLFDVLNDIRIIIDNDDALGEGITPAFDAYYLACFGVVQPPNKDYEVILSTYNQLAFGLYYDPISGEKFQYDSLQENGEFVDGYIERNPQYEPHRLALQDILKTFVSDYFPTGVSNVFQGDDCIHLCYVANLTNPHNYWSGRWLGDWKYNALQSSLTGTLNIKVHYYEDGNVQLNSSKDFNASLLKLNPEEVAQEIHQWLIKFNEQMRSSLENIFTELSDNSAKFLRRALPITKAKIDWEKINVYPTGDMTPLPI